MRTKVIIDGLNNTQKFRAIINGVVIGDCQVKDLNTGRFGEVNQRLAVWNTLMTIAVENRIGNKIRGLSRQSYGVDVQVDLV